MKNKNKLVLLVIFLLIAIAITTVLITKTKIRKSSVDNEENKIILVNTINPKKLFDLSRDTKDFGILNIKNNHAYIYKVKGEGQLGISFFSLDKGKVSKEIVLNYDWADPSLIISENYITFVNHDTKTLAAYDLNGEMLHSIFLESNFLAYESLVNFFPSVFDGEYFYVCNRFLKEPFFNIQKYDVEGYLIAEDLEDADAWQMLEYGDHLLLVDKENIRVFNKDCEKVSEVNLVEKAWPDWKFKDGECGLLNRTNCFVYNGLFFGMCEQPTLYVTDLKDYYQTYDFHDLLKLDKERTIDTKTEIRIFADQEYFYVLDLKEEVIYKFRVNVL